MNGAVRNLAARWRAAGDYLAACRGLFLAAVRYARARDGHGRAGAWGNRIMAEHRRMVRARFVLTRGREPGAAR